MDSTEAPRADSGDEAEQTSDIVAIRRAKLKEWFAGRALPVDRRGYLSSLINGKGAFGEKAARGLEQFYGMPKGHLDGPLMDKALTLGDRIKRSRTEQGLTQQQLAEKVGVTQTAIAAWESGKRGVPKGDNLLRLAEALDFDADRLMGIARAPSEMPPDAAQLLAVFRALPKDKQLIAIKLVEALK